MCRQSHAAVVTSVICHKFQYLSRRFGDYFGALRRSATFDYINVIAMKHLVLRGTGGFHRLDAADCTKGDHDDSIVGGLQAM
jgi:hypothetical protein